MKLELFQASQHLGYSLLRCQAIRSKGMTWRMAAAVDCTVGCASRHCVLALPKPQSVGKAVVAAFGNPEAN